LSAAAFLASFELQAAVKRPDPAAINPNALKDSLLFMLLTV